MMLLELNFKLPTQSLTKEIISHLYNPKVVIFLCAMLLAGVVMGYLETFIYRYLGSLGGSPLLLSLTVAVVAPLNFFLTLASSFLVNLLGHAALISLGLFVISFRMFVYSMLVNPWWALPLEMLDALCSGLLTNVAIMYCTVLFSSKSITSSRGIISALNFGLGQLLGNLVGTEIREVMGDRATLQVFGGAAFVSAVLYGAAYLFITRQSLFTHSSTQGSNSPTETTNNHGTDNKSFEDTIEMEPSDSGTTENTREVL
ncbi:Major facilitator superfamily domain-containing protein 6-like 9 [Homarus americanus]|uniref:Major facilitator superfamily domain-containing protein 6-like 9 n=2 Tax=Homarus americanus TaxID=6706 RepID=A0A8J5K809_HOMAM|nr:Major facilitator superfamily domain-containing protein 6-like 9 [Homarus americanus]